MGEKKGFLMKVVVIGGGPAGMMAAITASKNGNEVYLLEKNDRLGKKLLITGKGRCNITSSLDIKDFIQNVPGNGRFLYSAFDNYTNLDIINFLKEHGVSVKEERGNRIFPTSDKSLDVLKAFEAELKNKRVKIKFNTRVVGIETKEKGSHAGRKYGTRAFLIPIKNPARTSAAIKPTLADRWVLCLRFRASSSSLHGRPMTGRSAIHRRTPSSR